jgi:tetratricopeptide (TPR) repeat protein
MLTLLGSSHFKLRQLQESLKAHLEAFDVRKKLLGLESVDVAISALNVARVYNELDQGQLAQEHFLQSINIFRKQPSKSVEMSNALFYLATLYVKHKHYKEAQALHEEALEIRRKVLGNQHSSVAASFYELGATYHWQGLTTKALEMYESAHALHSRISHKGTDAAKVLLGIGLINTQQGQATSGCVSLQEAKKLCQDSQCDNSIRGAIENALKPCPQHEAL